MSIEMNKNAIKHTYAQSVVEIIVAVAIFVIIAGSSVVTILGSFLTSRLAEEETKATSLAKQALEAASSIRNRSWDDLSYGQYGLNYSSGEWTLTGSSDLTGKFTRIVDISEVQRDTGNNIVESGGIVDPETKKVTVNVYWDFSSSRMSEVEISQYFTNWQLAKICVELPSGTPTPTPTSTPTPTFTPTPAPTSCAQFCQYVSYSAGTCRRDAQTCNSRGEVNESEGDVFCRKGANFDTCCCRP